MYTAQGFWEMVNMALKYYYKANFETSIIELKLLTLEIKFESTTAQISQRTRSYNKAEPSLCRQQTVPVWPDKEPILFLP